MADRDTPNPGEEVVGSYREPDKSSSPLGWILGLLALLALVLLLLWVFGAFDGDDEIDRTVPNTDNTINQVEQTPSDATGNVDMNVPPVE